MVPVADDSSAEILKQVRDWIVNFVETPHPLLGGFAPCPYARAARLDGLLDMRTATRATFATVLSDLAGEIRCDRKSVGLIAFADTKSWSVEEARSLVHRLRDEYRTQDLYVLWDHPENHEVVGHVRMNQGQYLILFIQKTSKLRDATRELQKAGYYTSWPEPQVARVMGSRFEGAEIAVSEDLEA